MRAFTTQGARTLWGTYIKIDDFSIVMQEHVKIARAITHLSGPVPAEYRLSPWSNRMSSLTRKPSRGSRAKCPEAFVAGDTCRSQHMQCENSLHVMDVPCRGNTRNGDDPVRACMSSDISYLRCSLHVASC
jgi:hypothetical protein